MVLLAALVHFLACAHGPTTNPAGRADALFLTASESCGAAAKQSQQATIQQTPPAKNDDVHCWGLDESTTQPPRDVALAVPAVVDVPPAEQLGAQTQPLPPAALQPSPHTPGVPYAGQTRARIGVWRT